MIFSELHSRFVTIVSFLLNQKKNMLFCIENLMYVQNNDFSKYVLVLTLTKVLSYQYLTNNDSVPITNGYFIVFVSLYLSNVDAPDSNYKARPNFRKGFRVTCSSSRAKVGSD